VDEQNGARNAAPDAQSGAKSGAQDVTSDGTRATAPQPPPPPPSRKSSRFIRATKATGPHQRRPGKAVQRAASAGLQDTGRAAPAHRPPRAAFDRIKPCRAQRQLSDQKGSM
jgi:hypothetical protein